MSTYNTIVFSINRYAVTGYDQEREKGVSEQLWRDVADFLRLATQQGYVCKIWDDDIGIVVIEYYHADKEYGGPYLEWLTDEEADLIDNFRHSTDDYQSNVVPSQIAVSESQLEN